MQNSRIDAGFNTDLVAALAAVLDRVFDCFEEHTGPITTALFWLKIFEGVIR